MTPPTIKFWLTVLCGLFAVFALMGAWRSSTAGAGERQSRYSPLLKIAKEVLTYGLIALVIVIVSLRINIWQNAAHAFEPIVTSNGTTIQKAAEPGFDRDTQAVADELKKRSKEYFMHGEKEFAANDYTSAAKSYKASTAILPTMAGYLNEAVSLYNVSDYDGAKQAALQGQLLARKNGDKGFEAAFLNISAIVCHDQGKPEVALNFYQQALGILKAIGNKPAQATTLINIAIVYHDQGRLSDAINYYQQALGIDKSIGNRKGEADDLNYIGIVYHDQGKADEALNYYRQALGIYKDIGNKSAQANALGNIGMVYQDQGKLDDALNFHQQALSIHKAKGNRKDEADDLNNIGIVYHKKGRLDEALNYYRQALGIHKAFGNRKGEAYALDNIGIVYRDQGKLDDAMVYYRQALDLYKLIGAGRNVQQTENDIEQVRAAIKKTGR